MYPPVTRILAIRHGETDWNVDTRIQGQLDIALNRTGRRQAERLANALVDEDLSLIFASDLARAMETAQLLARAKSLPVVFDTGLRERGFGIFEGYTFKEIEAHWPDEARRWRQRDPDFGPDGGETLRGFYHRCINTVTRLAQYHPLKTIAVVAHGGVMDCLYRAAARLDLQAPRSWQVANASINRLLYTPEGFSLVGWSDTAHLDGTGEGENGDDFNGSGH